MPGPQLHFLPPAGSHWGVQLRQWCWRGGGQRPVCVRAVDIGYADEDGVRWRSRNQLQYLRLSIVLLLSVRPLPTEPRQGPPRPSAVAGDLLPMVSFRLF